MHSTTMEGGAGRHVARPSGSAGDHAHWWRGLHRTASVTLAAAAAIVGIGVGVTAPLVSPVQPAAPEAAATADTAIGERRPDRDDVPAGSAERGAPDSDRSRGAR